MKGICSSPTFGTREAKSCRGLVFHRLCCRGRHHRASHMLGMERRRQLPWAAAGRASSFSAVGAGGVVRRLRFCVARQYDRAIIRSRQLHIDHLDCRDLSSTDLASIPMPGIAAAATQT
jgi:hypothetical protein